MGRKWTKEDELYLSDNFGEVSYQTMAENLHRSVNAVIAKADKMNLGKFLESGDYITFNQLIIALGVDRGGYKMTSWVKNRNFPLRKKRVGSKSFKIVRLDEFWKWAEKNQSLLDFSKMEENILGAEPEWVKRKRKTDFDRNRKYSNAPWTAQEDRELIRLLGMQKYSYTELSGIMHRTCGAIERRCVDLGLKDRPLKADNHVPWTQEQLNMLSDMIKAGYSCQ